MGLRKPQTRFILTEHSASDTVHPLTLIAPQPLTSRHYNTHYTITYYGEHKECISWALASSSARLNRAQSHCVLLMEAQDRITTDFFIPRIPCYILLFIWLLLKNSEGYIGGNFVNARYYTANVWYLPNFFPDISSTF